MGIRPIINRGKSTMTLLVWGQTWRWVILVVDIVVCLGGAIHPTTDGGVQVQAEQESRLCQSGFSAGRKSPSDCLRKFAVDWEDA
jgi:hypothetical protein